ncbi:GMC family oxidoreductase [Actinopolymorpha pittospori]
MTKTYDYIVVGAGSAGCVVAARLSEDKNVRVLLLEAGGPDSLELIHVPPAWTALRGTEVDWNYTTEPQPGTAGLAHTWPRGKVLGGSSSINAMVHLRGHRNDFDTWERQGAEGWGYRDVLPYFRKMEHVENHEPDYRGHGGPMRPAVAAAPNPLSAVFLEAAEELHYPITADFNGSVQEGAGWNELTIADGRRQSTSDAYLRPLMHRSNLTIRTDAQALQLCFDGRRCTGLEYQRGGGIERADADAEVIVCAGAVDSPRLLMLSGVGPADHLREVGIEVVHDLPGVGQNLHDHPVVGLVVEASQEIPAGTANRAEVSMLWRSDPGLPGPDMQIVFIHAPSHPPTFKTPANSYTFGITTVPRSRGWIRLASAHPDQPPLINPNYLDDEEDVRRLLLGIGRARELSEADAFASWRKEEVLPGTSVRGDASLREFIARHARTYYHPVGSCKMGTDVLAVVDPELKVRGLDGLRVVDASVIPSILCVNVNPATIMIGEKAADLIRGRSTSTAPTT